MFLLGGSDSRNLFLTGEITSESVNPIIQQILDFSSEDQESAETKIGFQPEPVMLYINSGGGSVYDGFALIDAIDMSFTPVYTVCLGQAMSMALAILLAGEARFAGKNSTIMYHGIWGTNHGNLKDQKKNIAHMDALQDRYDQFVIERSSLTNEHLEIAKDEGDWFMTADVAKKNGIIDEILPLSEEAIKKYLGE